MTGGGTTFGLGGFLLELGPSRRSDFGDVVVGQVWEAGEGVAQVGVRIDSSAAAAFDDGVDGRAAMAGTGFADEEPVLFAEGGGANGHVCFNVRVTDVLRLGSATRNPGTSKFKGDWSILPDVPSGAIPFIGVYFEIPFQNYKLVWEWSECLEFSF